MCDANTRAVLEVRSDLISKNQWINVLLACRDDGFASLSIYSDEAFLDEDSIPNIFPFTQRVSRRWAACFGSCISSQSFTGGLREVLMMQRFIDHKESQGIFGHQVLAYNNDIKAYFKFGKELERFNKDYYVDRTWLSFSGLNETQPLSSVQGLDYIANDVCEMSYIPESFLQFKRGVHLEKYNLGEVFKQGNYDYTMSMQVMVNDTNCVTSSISTAEEKDCSLIELEGVFMIYFLHSNMMQVRFFATKNYYETSTRTFFVPNDQWVTI